MLLGDFESAWRESDAIESRGAHDPNQFWDGTNLTGKCVMVRCLHGLGDAIQYARYLPLLRHQASHLIVEAPPDLVCLFEPLDSIDEVITWGEAAPESQPHWEAQIEITELPRYFRSTSDNLPCNVPYLFVPEHLVTLSQDRLGASASMRTGLLWQSSSWNPARSLLLEELTPILACTSFSCYSLQRGEGRRQLEAAKWGYNIIDTALTSRTILETAADILNLDLVITVDTMVAHLAGALRKPVWTLLPFEADWRWMIRRSDTPWYPTMRLFRQRSKNDWTPVIAEVKHELESLVSTFKPHTGASSEHKTRRTRPVP